MQPAVRNLRYDLWVSTCVTSFQSVQQCHEGPLFNCMSRSTQPPRMHKCSQTRELPGPATMWLSSFLSGKDSFYNRSSGSCASEDLTSVMMATGISRAASPGKLGSCHGRTGKLKQLHLTECIPSEVPGAAAGRCPRQCHSERTAVLT